MGKAFTKGQRVTVMGDWDRKGTVWVRHATVHSCGTKVLRLTCDVTGDEFGDEYAPVVAEQGRCGVRHRLDGSPLEAEAIAVAKHQRGQAEPVPTPRRLDERESRGSARPLLGDVRGLV